MSATWRVEATLDDAATAEVEALLESIERATGDEALSEDALDLRRRGSVRHAIRRSGDELTGYAVLGEGSTVHAEPALGTYDDELSVLLESSHRRTSLLLRAVGDALVDRLVARGWRMTRCLHRLRRPLPADPSPTTTLEVRAFRPGVDEATWVEQNNAAFTGHPSQGAMTVERVLAREQSPWFDPDGFLLFLDAGVLVASCWTKVHHAVSGAVGEIYVISVAPWAQGRGLGRLAVLRGLEYLASLGIRTAELYVEETNRAAYQLYESLGFTYDARVVELVVDGG